MDKVEKPDQEWRAALDPEQYRVTRQAGTEAPFSGQYCDHFEPGAYHCVCCAHPLFDSDSKFHSGCGWPSFHGELDEAFIVQRRDLSHGMIRTELLCPALPRRGRARLPTLACLHALTRLHSAPRLRLGARIRARG